MHEPQQSNTIISSKTERVYFHDFKPGTTFEMGAVTIRKNDIITFAQEFDPHPFHLDEKAGKKSLMGGLCASGWQLCGIIMRLACDTYINRAASMGSFGIDEVKWIKPVFPEDTVSARCHILNARISQSKPEMGIVTIRWDGFRQSKKMKKRQKAATIIGTNLFAVKQTV